MTRIKLVLQCLIVGLCAANTVFAQSSYNGYNGNSGYDYNAEGIRIGDSLFNDVLSHQVGPFDIDGKDVGPFAVKAKVSSEMDYDSNIFWTPNHKLADTINVTSPAVLVNMPLGFDQRNLVQMMYNADIGTFAKYSSQNYVNQYGSFNGDFTLPFGYVDIQDNFDHTSDRADTEFTGEVVRTDNQALAALGIKFNKLALETGYSDNLRTYEDSLYAADQYIEDMVSEIAYYQLFPKTKALFEYDHGWLTYYDDTARSGAYDQERIGLKGNITGKTVALIKLGFQDRTYNNSQSFSGFVAEVGTITQLTERTKLSLTYDQGAQESVYLNNNYYNMHYFYATLDQKIMGHWSAELTSGISRNIYPEVDPTLFQKRMDSILIEGISFKYTIKQWASFKIGYTFREDISTIKAESYNDHLASAGFTLQF